MEAVDQGIAGGLVYYSLPLDDLYRGEAEGVLYYLLFNKYVVFKSCP